MAFLKRTFRRIASEPAVTVGVVIAAANTAVDQTWQGYAAAIATALLRFAVSPVVAPPEPKE